MPRKSKRSLIPGKGAWRWAATAAGIVIVGGGIAAVIHGTSHGGGAAHKPVVVRVALPPPPAPPPVPAPVIIQPASLPAVPTSVVQRPVTQPAALQPPVVQPPPVPAKPAELPAWRKFAAVAPAAAGRPMIAVVIDDLGVDRRRSSRAVSLPGPLTLSWLPYASDVRAQAASARAAGHETLVHMPMQPQGSENPGPNALTTDLSIDEVRRRLDASLAIFPQAVGLNNHMGSRFTRDAHAMAPVVEELKSRGLLFLDSRTSGGSVAGELAREAGVPSISRDVFLDNQQTHDYVRARLAEVEAHAQRHGTAVAIGHPHDATLDVLEEWLRSLPSRGFVLVPLTAIVKQQLERPVAARG